MNKPTVEVEKVKVRCWFNGQPPVIAGGEIKWCNGIRILIIHGCIGMSAYQVTGTTP